MRPATLSAATLLAGSAVAADDCVNGLHIIVGRGTGEPAGTGVTGGIADKIAKQIGNSDVVPLVYPATLEYTDSVENGTNAIIEEVTSYAKKCPGGKMAYLGYSQGAQIASNAFCGGQGGIFPENEPIPASAVKDVVAIAIFGDPSHNKDFTYNEGTSTKDGLFHRDTEGACANFADKIKSWCDTGDIYCDVGENKTVHGLYLSRYGEDIQNFVVGQYKDSLKAGNSTTTSAVPTSTPTGGMGGGNSTMTNSHSPPTPTGGNGGNGGNDGGSGGSPPTAAAAGLTVNSLFVALPLAMVAAAQMLL